VSWTKKGFFIELPSPDLIASLDSLAFCKKKGSTKKRKINSTKHLNKKNYKRGFKLYGTV